MSDKLDVLLECLKAHQRDLILAMAEHDGMPAGSDLRQVAELENVIALNYPARPCRDISTNVR